MKPTLLILAAGMGSRYGGLKQIVSVGPNGEFLMDYAVYDAIQAGFGKIVFLITEIIEQQFKEEISSRYCGLIEIDYAFQRLDSLPSGFTVPENRVKPWGTGHAILSAKENIDGPFAVINADDYYGATSFQIMANALTQMSLKTKEWCLVGFQLKNTLSEYGSVSRGICTSENGYLASVVEREKIEKLNGGIYYLGQNKQKILLPNETLVSMNMWGFASESLFPFLESEFKNFLEINNSEKSEFYIPFAVDTSIKKEWATVKVLETQESWFGLTFTEDKETVKHQILEKIKSGIYPEKLFASPI